VTLDLLISTLLTVIVSSGAMTLLLKKWIEHSFHKRISKMEAEQRLRAHEHQVRFTRYDEKLTLAIEGAYELVCDYADELKALVEKAIQGEAKLEDSVALDLLAEKFNKFMRRQSIYLPSDITVKLNETRQKLRDLVNEELMRTREFNQRAKDGEQVSRALEWVYRRDGIENRCGIIMSDLQSMAKAHLNRFTAEK
jgi:hypothetical protein